MGGHFPARLAVQQVLYGGLVEDFENGLVHPLPHGREGTFGVEGALVALRDALVAFARRRLALLHEPDHVADTDALGWAKEIIAAGVPPFGIDEPTALERSYLPHELCPGILEYDFSTNSLYEILSTVYGRRPDHAEQVIEAKLATTEVAQLLDLKPPAVVFVFHRETRLASGQVIEYVDSELRGDRFRFYTNLRLLSSTGDFVFRRLPLKQET